MTWQSQAMALLTASLVRPLILAAAAWLILRVFRVRHPASRHAVWTAALIGMMVLPIVSIVAPQWKLPLLPKKQAPVAQTQVQQSDNFIDTESFDFRPNVVAAPVKFAWPTTQALIVWLYLVGVFAMAIFRLTGWALLWRVMSKSRSLRMRLRESSDVVTPVTVGVLRPSVILPAGWRNWNANTKRAVLAHEFAHIRRRDTLTSSLTRFAKCIYWFHPLTWWISQQISELAELSCDAAALEKSGDPASYSRILLSFAETVNAAGYRAALPGLAIASRSGMSHRIDQVFELASGNLRRLSRPGTVLALMGLPVMCIAAVIGLTAPSSHVLQQEAAVIASPKPVIVAQVQQPTVAPPKFAQPVPPTPKPKFEVASIRTCPASVGSGGRGGGGGGRLNASSGRLFAECQTLATFIRYAYLGYLYDETESHRLVASQEFKGIPAWGNSDRYTIEATGTGTETKEMLLGPMLRTLLEDRFGLQIHRETREVPVYDLVVAKGGPKLQPAREGSCVPRDPNAPPVMPGPGVARICGMTYRPPPGDGLYMYGTTMARLCVQFSAFLDLDVVDKTGLTEAFDLRLDLAPEDISVSWANHTDSQTSAIFSAMANLGLKLESAKGPGEFIVVDHAERPTEN